ncbi:MAG: WG repeat-containing protein [Zoogloeaceae bacterium]|jgi:hypothetical protein|nr:WG repeat-containing protein [Zoogloeaceae bacterium]
MQSIHFRFSIWLVRGLLAAFFVLTQSGCSSPEKKVEVAWAIAPRFDYAEAFAANGLARVETAGKWGYIDAKGEVVIAPRFDHASDFAANGLARVGVRDKHGRLKHGYINEKGKEVIAPRFLWAYDFAADGLARVENMDRKFGCINAKGEEVIPSRFDWTDDKGFAANGLLAVGIAGKYGYINKKGEEVIAPRFDSAWPFAANGLALVLVIDAHEWKYGYINEKGEETIPLRFDNAWPFAANGLARVVVGKKYGYIDGKGKEIVPPRFDEAYDFAANGLAQVRVEGKYGYINEKGEEVIPPRFDSVGDFSANGLAAVGVKSGQRASAPFVPEKPVSPNPSLEDHLVREARNTARRLSSEGWNFKFGFINEKGEEVIPPRFDGVWPFAANGLAVVKEGSKWGFVRVPSAR